MKRYIIGLPVLLLLFGLLSPAVVRAEEAPYQEAVEDLAESVPATEDLEVIPDEGTATLLPVYIAPTAEADASADINTEVEATTKTADRRIKSDATIGSSVTINAKKTIYARPVISLTSTLTLRSIQNSRIWSQRLINP